jgi:hypothetical protein
MTMMDLIGVGEVLLRKASSSMAVAAIRTNKKFPQEEIPRVGLLGCVCGADSGRGCRGEGSCKGTLSSVFLFTY